MILDSHETIRLRHYTQYRILSNILYHIASGYIDDSIGYRYSKYRCDQFYNAKIFNNLLTSIFSTVKILREENYDMRAGVFIYILKDEEEE